MDAANVTIIYYPLSVLLNIAILLLHAYFKSRPKTAPIEPPNPPETGRFDRFIQGLQPLIDQVEADLSELEEAPIEAEQSVNT